MQKPKLTDVVLLCSPSLLLHKNKILTKLRLDTNSIPVWLKSQTRNTLKNHTEPVRLRVESSHPKTSNYLQQLDRKCRFRMDRVLHFKSLCCHIHVTLFAAEISALFFHPKLKPEGCRSPLFGRLPAHNCIKCDRKPLSRVKRSALVCRPETSKNKNGKTLKKKHRGAGINNNIYVNNLWSSYFLHFSSKPYTRCYSPLPNTHIC